MTANMILRPFRALRHQPWALSSAIPPRIEPSLLVEEENSPYYDPAYFYPVRIGEIMNGRYQIATKLGHGSRGTVWLARDLHQWRFLNERYVAIKVNSNHDHKFQIHSSAELETMQRITTANRQHVGWHFVRKLLDSFKVQGVNGNHICLVFEPLRETLERYCRRWENGVMPPQIFKIVLQEVLQALDYLHTDCRLIHTDLKPDNIMVRLEDHTLLSQDALDEHTDPLPQKHCEDGRIIYLSRKNFGRLKKITGIIEITDFDLARPGCGGHLPRDGCIQAEVFRAPEVILNRGFSYSADIWSLGVMLWDFLEGKSLFEAVDPYVTDYDDSKHLAYITALLGPIPREMTCGGKRTSLFYTEDGTPKHKNFTIPKNFTFETTLSKFSGKEKKMFISFVRRMVNWRPEERSTAKELLQDPWLHNDYPEN